MYSLNKSLLLEHIHSVEEKCSIVYKNKTNILASFSEFI